jgi:hypothetical protein
VSDEQKRPEPEPGFQVRDRRRFDASGDARDEERTASGTAAPSGAAGAQPDAELPVTFSTFLLGLSTQALLHLGEIPNPLSNQVETDLAAAKHVIDILGVLETKTRGNLDEGEQQLVASVLYDLRMRYVEIMRRQPKEGS